jgi:hypothetical protein
VDDQPGTLLGQRQCQGFAQAYRAAGDNRDFSVEFQFEITLLSAHT